MRVSVAERLAIKTVVAYGAQFGYGNLIAHLKSAWAETLMRDYGFTEAEAQRGSLDGGFPVAMHRDIIDNGEWDETGARYDSPPPAAQREEGK